MFFVSEEFLRKHEVGDEFDQTIEDAVPEGQGLFEDTAGKREYNIKNQEGSAGP